MIEKGRISAFQLGLIMFPTILATATLVIPVSTYIHAGKELWLSPVWATASGFLVLFLCFRLHLLFPQETIIQYCVHILGRVLGKIVGFLVILFYLYTNGIVIREYGEFVSGAFLVKTPLIVIIFSMVAVCAYCVSYGIESIGRCAILFVPFNIFFTLLIMLLLIPDLHVENLFPMFEEGIGKSLKGSLVPLGWFSEFMLVSFLLPYVHDHPNRALKWGIYSILTCMFMMVIINLGLLFLFDELLAGTNYPLFLAARFVSLANFFEHIEAIVMAIWVLSVFIKVSVFYYATLLGLSQWLHLEQYRELVIPVGILQIIVSLWTYPSMQAMKRELGTNVPFYLLFVQCGILLLLFLVATIKRKRRTALEQA